MFRDSPEEKRLRDAVNGIANVVGSVCEGRISTADLQDLWNSQLPEVQTLYDSVAAKHGPKAPRRILTASYDIANISAGGLTNNPAGGKTARELMHEVLLTLNRHL
jgi:hypothetical protein